MISPARFDRIHGKGAFLRLCSMLADPAFAYEHIAKNLGLTKQRIGQLAKDFGVDGRQREHERIVRREPRVINKEYPRDIRAVVHKIRRSGIQVIPYDSLHSDRRAWRSQRKNSVCERRLLQHSTAQRSQTEAKRTPLRSF